MSSPQDKPWAVWITYIHEYPYLWLCINLGLWLFIGGLLLRVKSNLAEKCSNVITLTYKLNLPARVQNLRRFLKSKNVEEETLRAMSVLPSGNDSLAANNTTTCVCVASWEEQEVPAHFERNTRARTNTHARARAHHRAHARVVPQSTANA